MDWARCSLVSPMVFAVILLNATRSVHIMRVGFFHNRYLAVCASVFRRIGFIEASFLLFEARLFDSDVLNVVLSGILDIVCKINVK